MASSALQSQPPAPMEVITVPAARVGGTVSLGGTVVPFKEVTLAAEVGGRVESIAGEEGDAFAAGSVLVTINDEDLLAQRSAAVADYVNADLSLRNAGMQYSREWISPYGGEYNDMLGGMPSMFKQFTNPMQSMFGGGHPRYERYTDLYSYRTRVDQARSALVRAQSRIAEIDSKLRDTRSVAPFDGVISDKLVEVGDTVQPGQPMLRFADTASLQIRVEVPARLMPGVEEGMIVPARLDVGDVEVEARVAQIYPIANPTRHTVTVKLDLPQGVPGGAGMYAEVMMPDINAQVREMPVIPKSALVWRGSLPGVFVVNDQNQKELRLVRTGERIGQDGIAILSGLRAGERIVVGGAGETTKDWESGGRR
jgi:multidrug efflux pump subunit AcrA (membrane-fusion protein)